MGEFFLRVSIHSVQSAIGYCFSNSVRLSVRHIVVLYLSEYKYPLNLSTTCRDMTLVFSSGTAFTKFKSELHQWGVK